MLRVTVGCTALNGTSVPLPSGSEDIKDGSERCKSQGWSVVEHCLPGMPGHYTQKSQVAVLPAKSYIDLGTQTFFHRWREKLMRTQSSLSICGLLMIAGGRSIVFSDAASSKLSKLLPPHP